MVVKSDGLKTKNLYKTIHKASKLKAEKYNIKEVKENIIQQCGNTEIN